MKLNDTFAVLKPDLSIEPVAVSPTIYQELDARFDHFRGHVLISLHAFDADWPTWEKHPAGDEVVVLLSGSAKFVLKMPSGEERVELAEPGSCVIVPRDTWHTARVSEPTRMLFVTPGEGTENRAES
jgi:mannose-6-phosphate isomerase-like protein (cupin superfamily)